MERGDQNSATEKLLQEPTTALITPWCNFSQEKTTTKSREPAASGGREPSRPACLGRKLDEGRPSSRALPVRATRDAGASRGVGAVAIDPCSLRAPWPAPQHEGQASDARAVDRLQPGTTSLQEGDAQVDATQLEFRAQKVAANAMDRQAALCRDRAHAGGHAR